VSAFIFGGCGPAAEEGTSNTTPTTPPTAKPVEWRFTTWDPPFDIFSVERVSWAKRLEEATNGRLKITFYFSESLVKMPGMFDAIVSGTADVGNASTSMFPERFKLTRVQNLLFVYKSQPQTGQTMMALYNKYPELRNEFTPTKVIWWNAPPPEDIATKDKQVKTAEDLEGLKIASTSAQAVKGLTLLGAVPVPVIVTEKYQALETGIVDGTADDWNAIYLWKLYEVTKYRTDNVKMAGRGFPTLVNPNSYDKLPADLKQAFDQVTDPMEMTIRVNQAHVDFTNESIAKIKEFDAQVGNPEWYVLPDTERDRWREITKSVNEDYIKELNAAGLPGDAFVAEALALAEQYK